MHINKLPVEHKMAMVTKIAGSIITSARGRCSMAGYIIKVKLSDEEWFLRWSSQLANTLSFVGDDIFNET